MKENNCIDGKHYYALVEANIRYYNVNAANAFYEPKYAGLKNTDQVEVNGAKVIVPTLTVNSSSPLFDKDGKYLVEDNSNIENMLIRLIALLALSNWQRLALRMALILLTITLTPLKTVRKFLLMITP